MLSGYFDRVDSGAGYKKLHTFGVLNETPFCDFSREFRVVVSAATGTGRVLAPGVGIVLEVVRIAANEQYISLIPALYPGLMAMESRPFGTLDAMWLAFQALSNNKPPAINGDIFLPCLLLRRACGHPPRGPGKPVMGAARAGRFPSRLHGRQDRAIIPDCTDPLLDASSNCWFLDEHYYAEVLAVCSSIQTDDPPLWSGLLTPTIALPPSEKTGATA